MSDETVGRARLGAPGGWLRLRLLRFPGLLALVVVLVLDAAVNDTLTLNGLLDTVYPDLIDGDLAPTPLWEQPTLWFVGGALLCWLCGWWRPLRWLTIAANAFATGSVALLVGALAVTVLHRQGSTGAQSLLKDAGLVWVMTWLVYAIWYWLLDGGGPVRRTAPEWRPDLIFPQQQQAVPGWEGWRPSFLDYLSVSFLINTTFNAGGTFLFARWSIILSVAQAFQAIVLILFLAARAIGAFGG